MKSSIVAETRTLAEIIMQRLYDISHGIESQPCGPSPSRLIPEELGRDFAWVGSLKENRNRSRVARNLYSLRRWLETTGMEIAQQAIPTTGDTFKTSVKEINFYCNFINLLLVKEMEVLVPQITEFPSYIVVADENWEVYVISVEGD